MDKRKDRKLNKGFTLVELIVVIVILAVLAAVLVPALLGYIEKAKTKKDLQKARQALEAVQAELVQEYAKAGTVLAQGTPVISGNICKPNDNLDVDLCGSNFSKRVFANLGISEDQEPYFLLIMVGSNAEDKWIQKNGKKVWANSDKVTAHDKYTVFYAIYKDKQDSKMLYYYEGEWSTINPRIGKNGKDIIGEGNMVDAGKLKGKRLQYYIISYKGTEFDKPKWDKRTVWDSGFWTKLWNGTL